MREQIIPEVKSERSREGQSLYLVFRESKAHSDRKVGPHKALDREVLISGEHGILGSARIFPKWNAVMDLSIRSVLDIRTT